MPVSKSPLAVRVMRATSRSRYRSTYLSVGRPAATKQPRGPYGLCAKPFEGLDFPGMTHRGIVEPPAPKPDKWRVKQTPGRLWKWTVEIRSHRKGGPFQVHDVYLFRWHALLVA